MRLSVAFMAHPAREAYLPPLLEALGDIPIVWDGGWNDRHITGLKAMRAYDPTATHHLVLQDDIILSRDLIKAVEKMIVHSGEHPIALYCGKVRPRHNAIPQLIAQCRASKSPWFEYEGPWWGPGIVFPTAHIPALTAFYERRPEVSGYDRRCSRWYNSEGITCLYAAPSLLDHRTIEEHGNYSLVYNRTGRYRGAYWFIGERKSGTDTDWSIPPIGMNHFSTCQHGKLSYERCVHCGRWN
jgi:hypothetical protein